MVVRYQGMMVSGMVGSVSAGTWLSQGPALALVAGLLLSPYVIHHLGDERYGIWVLVFSLVDYYGLVDFGFRSAVVKYAAHFRATGEMDRLETLISTGLAYFSIAAIAVAAVSFADLAAEALAGLPLAVEFRHKSWLHDTVFAGLAERRVTLVAVDEPQLPDLLPPLSIVTNPDLFYVRFHGRNDKDWYGNTPGADRYKYDYSERELREWLPKIESLAAQTGQVLLFFNNCHSGQAAKNAKRLKKLLGMV